MGECLTSSAHLFDLSLSLCILYVHSGANGPIVLCDSTTPLSMFINSHVLYKDQEVEEEKGKRVEVQFTILHLHVDVMRTQNLVKGLNSGH